MKRQATLPPETVIWRCYYGVALIDALEMNVHAVLQSKKDRYRYCNSIALRVAFGITKDADLPPTADI